MKYWNREERGLYTKAQRKVAEQAFWLAAEVYENSAHTHEDAWAAWDRVIDYTKDVDARIATRDLLKKQYYGFHTIANNWFYVDSTEHAKQPFTRAQLLAEARRTLHPSQKNLDLEQFYTEVHGKPAHVRSGFGYA